MIDPQMENIYNIILSLILGVVVAIIFNQVYDTPCIANVYKVA
jgi:hypothetical protein